MKSRKTLAIIIGICAFFISLTAAFIGFLIYIKKIFAAIFVDFPFDDFFEPDNR